MFINDPESFSKKKPKFPDKIAVNINNTSYSSVERNILALDWEITCSTIENTLFWCDSNVNVEFCLNLEKWQFVNHFPGTFCITRKIDLARSLFRMKKRFPHEYNFHPKSFIIPVQKMELQQFLSNSQTTFIVKPDLGSQGNGIFLIQKPEQILDYKDSAIAQEYINPYLIRGLKFDFRIYALITSIEPLRIYIFKEGMGRFCTKPYHAPTSKNLNDIFSHLTNYSINKKNNKFKQNDDPIGAEDSSKRAMSAIFAELALKGCDISALQAKIDKIIVLTVLSGQPQIAHNYKSAVKEDGGRSRCFEILGFDIMIDSQFRPWLLEVNHSPSLSCDSAFDTRLKDGLIQGTLKTLNFDPGLASRIYDQEREKTLGRINGSPHKSTQADFSEFEKKKLIQSMMKDDYSKTVKEEARIAQQNGWRMLYPVDGENATLYDMVLKENIKMTEEDTSFGTLASKGRRDAILAQIAQRENERRHEKIIPPIKSYLHPSRPTRVIKKAKTTRAQMLYFEAQKNKINKEAQKESMFLNIQSDVSQISNFSERTSRKIPQKKVDYRPKTSICRPKFIVGKIIND